MLQVVSHNVRRFRFRLPDKKMVVGLPTGSHITIAAKDVDGKDVMRPYTPVTDDTSKGYVDFVIKVKRRATPRLYHHQSQHSCGHQQHLACLQR